MAEHKGDIDVDGIVVARDIRIKRGKHGDLLYRARQLWKKLHIGTPGQVLTVDANNFPSWQTPTVPVQMVTGTYVGDGQASQHIAAAFKIKHLQVYALWGAPGQTELFHNKNDQMLNWGQTYLVALPGTIGLVEVTEYTKLSAVTGFDTDQGPTHSNFLNIQGVSYRFTAWG